MEKITIALEWFLNPDHLPMIAGIQSKAYEQKGLRVELIAPDEHYDGFEYLKKGEIDIHCNEPLHLFEHYFDGLKSMGCFFETDGGVMIKQSSVEKLHNNQPIKITTPASNEITNKIGFEILKRYAKQNGFELSKENVDFVQTDFYHLKNMKEQDFDGAWLCFYNFEGIEALHENFEHLFIDTKKSPYPNFSALEFMTTQETINQKGQALCDFIDITNQMAQKIQTNLEFAKQCYYEYSQEEKSELMDKIIQDTSKRLICDIKADDKKWYNLWQFLEELDIVNLSQEQYNTIWETEKH
jgi:ABC-type nitrate/sulfonate/bicarbonate transport system substrate-binding protein